MRSKQTNKPIKKGTTLAQRGVRTPAPAEGATDLTAMARAFAASLSTNLRAKSGLPTFAERIAKEGVAAQLRGKGAKPKPTKAAKKPRARTARNVEE